MIKDAKIFLIIIIVVSSALLLSGCIATDTDNNEFDVIFSSDIVDLVEYDVEYNYDNNNNANQINVNGRISTKLDRIVNVSLLAKFYDKDNQYIGESNFNIFGLRPKGGPGSSTTFTIVFEGLEASLVEEIDLSAFEIER